MENEPIDIFEGGNIIPENKSTIIIVVIVIVIVLIVLWYFMSKPALKLTANQKITADNAFVDGSSTLVMEGGNLVIKSNGQTVWSTGTNGTNGMFLLQDDGNAVVYNNDGTVLWATNTEGTGVKYLTIAGKKMNLYTEAGKLVKSI